MAIAAAITLPLTAVKHRSLSSTSSSLWFPSSSIQPPRNPRSTAICAAQKPSFRVFSSMSIQAPEKASATSFLDRKESGILHFVKYHGLGNDFILLWRRICNETSTEIVLLEKNWKYILGGLVFQYIHGLAARGVHYIHWPGPTLQDVGFFLLPCCMQWTFHPFFSKSKKIFTVLIWCRVHSQFGGVLLRQEAASGTAAQLLPLSKDTKIKEENHKLMNGNSGDSADWRPRTQINAKIMEEGNGKINEQGINSTV